VELLRAGFDTVKLRAAAFEIDDGARLWESEEQVRRRRPTSRTVLAAGQSDVGRLRWKVGPGNIGLESPADTSEDRGVFWYEVSAPKVLGSYGNASEAGGVMLTSPGQMFELARLASFNVKEQLGVDIEERAWEVSRLDVAADFACDPVEGRRLIQAVERADFPRRKPSSYGHGETAMHGGRRNVFRVYDKGIEAKLVQPVRNVKGRRIAAGDRPRLQAGELVRFERQKRFTKQERPAAWGLDGLRVGRILFNDVETLVARYPNGIEVAGAIQWAIRLLREPDRWPTQGQRGASSALTAGGGAVLLAELGKQELITILGESSGQRLLRTLRHLDYAPAIEPGEPLESFVVNFTSARDQIADAFNLVDAREAA
jgi:hypothetical protein